MSATTTDAAAVELPAESGLPSSEPRSVRLAELYFTCFTVLVLIIGTVLSWDSVSQAGAWMIPWLLLVTAAELLPVFYTDQVSLTLSMPLLLAAGMTLGPVPAGILGFLGCWDWRLVRGEMTWARAFFNRSQIAMSCLCGALVFRSFGVPVDDWPKAMLPCLVAVGADVIINVSLVSWVTMQVTGKSFAIVAKGIVFDSPVVFVAIYLGLAPLALLMATAAQLYGIAGLAAGVVPLLMARQVFVLLKRASMTSRETQQQRILIEELENRIESERRDERARLAMDLHDGALAELFRVHLLGEVLRQDLSSGRLLDLESDVPELREATTAATDSLRTLIRSLRESPVGAQGICRTLDLLIEELSSRTRALMHTDIAPVSLPPSLQLVLYQVAREALENAVRHSGAQNIFVSLRDEGDWIRLIVRDDGSGFLRDHVDGRSHFGLDIMDQRVDQAGGLLHVASEPGWGTQVVVRMPTERTRRGGAN